MQGEMDTSVSSLDICKQVVAEDTVFCSPLWAFAFTGQRDGACGISIFRKRQRVPAPRDSCVAVPQSQHLRLWLHCDQKLKHRKPKGRRRSNHVQSSPYLIWLLTYSYVSHVLGKVKAV